jgi:hypothetical protein
MALRAVRMLSSELVPASGGACAVASSDLPVLSSTPLKVARRGRRVAAAMEWLGRALATAGEGVREQLHNSLPRLTLAAAAPPPAGLMRVTQCHPIPCLQLLGPFP